MFQIKSAINLNQSWTQIDSFITPNEEVLIVTFKRNVLGCVQASLQHLYQEYNENSVLVMDNDIINVHYSESQLLIVDSKGTVFGNSFGNDGKHALEKITQIPCETLLASCILSSKESLVCLSCDKLDNLFIQNYNLKSKTLKSCPFVKPKSKTSSKYILRCVCPGDSKMVLIGCPDGSIVDCSPDCGRTEILHQCKEAIEEIFEKDGILYFVLSDGCILEYKAHQVSLQCLPQSIPKHCVFMSPYLAYSDGRTTFLCDMNELSIQELPVKGVINLCHSSGHLFLLTLQGMLYTLQDSSSDQFLSKLNQFDSLNSKLDAVDVELAALSIHARARQLKCRFVWRLCVSEGELAKAYKFRLDLSHTCEGVTFDPTVWSCLCSVANDHVVLPLSHSLAPGSTVHLDFVLTDFELASHVFLKIYLVSGSNSELRIPVADSILTLFYFCSPATSTDSEPVKFPYTESLPLKPDLCGDILHRVLLPVRHRFTKDAWDKVRAERTVLLKYGRNRIELCVADRNRELLVKSTSEEVCKSVARIVQAGFISAGFLYSDYLKLESIKVDAEMDDFEHDTMDLAAIKKRLNELKSI